MKFYLGNCHQSTDLADFWKNCYIVSPALYIYDPLWWQSLGAGRVQMCPTNIARHITNHALRGVRYLEIHKLILKSYFQE